MKLKIATGVEKTQYPALQPIQRKPVVRAIDSHATDEIVRQYRYTSKYPVEIARDLGVSRAVVDATLKARFGRAS